MLLSGKKRFSSPGKRKNAEKGQVLVEYAVMLVLITVLAVAFFGFGYYFCQYGGHLVDMVSTEYP